MRRTRKWSAARIAFDSGRTDRPTHGIAPPGRAQTQPTTVHQPGGGAESARHNGKVERYNRILTEEFLYARTWTSESPRTEAPKIWNIHFDYHRPHTATGVQPPASRLVHGVTNVIA
jgi:hypothetical protein